jgi:SAM-dependent methyltransferase
MAIFKSFGAYIKSVTKWEILVFLFILLLILCFIKNDFSSHVEGFEQKSKYKIYENENIYDSFYADIYDELFIQPNKIEAEIDEIIHITEANKKIKKGGGGRKGSRSNDDTTFKACDLGCGRGHHVDQLQHKGVNVVGCDNSPAMLQCARDLYPSSKFIEGDFMDPMLFSEEEFDVLTCFYFTVYYAKDKRAFLKNCYQWLRPEGYLIIHLVDRNHFDPIVPGGKPLFLVTPQKYAKERITNSVVKFRSFQYKSDFKVPGTGPTKNGNKNSDAESNNSGKYSGTKNVAKFVEKFTDDKTGKVRENVHTYYMPTNREMLEIAKEVGFVVTGQVDLVHVLNEYQYLYILRKS